LSDARKLVEVFVDRHAHFERGGQRGDLGSYTLRGGELSFKRASGFVHGRGEFHGRAVRL